MRKAILKKFFDEKQINILKDSFKIKSVEQLLDFRDNTINLSKLAKPLSLEIRELAKKINEIEKNIGIVDGA